MSLLQPKCFHGSSEEAFDVRGEYYTAVKDYIQMYRNAKTCEEFLELMPRFDKAHRQLLVDPGFGRFVFAHCTQHYLAKGNDDKKILITLLQLGIEIRYFRIPIDEGKDVGPGSSYHEKSSKYMRDIHTDRGMINCLARETPCDCMKEKKTEAKSMEKLGFCFCCRREFPKGRMLMCSGCRFVKYCSKECQFRDWPAHKLACPGFCTTATNDEKRKEGETRLEIDSSA